MYRPLSASYPYFTDLDGSPLEGGYVYFGEENQNPETNPGTVYWDAAGTIPAAQPLRTTNGYIVRNGTPSNVYANVAVSITVRDQNKRIVFTEKSSADGVQPLIALLESPSGSGVIGYGQTKVGDALDDVGVSIMKYGAVGDGVTDDTAAATAAAASGLNIVVPYGVTIAIKDAKITLANGQKWSGGGTVKQISGSIDPQPATPGSPYPASLYPVFALSSVGASVEGLKIIPLIGEGVAITADGCTVNNCTIDGQGNTWYDGINVYANDCKITFNKIVDCGHWYSDTTYSLRGDGVFLSGTGFKNCRVIGNYMRGNGRNGVLVIGHMHGVISGNVMHGNRGSVVQFAFLNMPNNVKFMSVVGNVGYYNGADCFDCNNNAGVATPVISSVVSNNTFLENGWLYPTRAEQLSRTGTKQDTNDGGGATIINVSDVTYNANVLVNNNRVCGYISNANNIIYTNNNAQKNSSSTADDVDGIRVYNSTGSKIHNNRIVVPKTVIRLDGDCSRTDVTENYFECTLTGNDGAATPSGTIAGKFEQNTIKIVSGYFVLNPIIEMKANKFIATTAGNLSFGAGFSNKRLIDNDFDIAAGSIVFSSVASAKIYGGEITANTAASSGALAFGNCTGTIRVSGVRINQSGTTAGLLFYGASSTANVYLRDVAVKGNAAGNSIRVNAEVTSSLKLWLDGYYNEQGSTDYGASDKKFATYA